MSNGKRELPPTLKRWRGALGLRQAQIATLAGCTRSYVSMVEKGYQPRAQRAEALAKAYELTLSEFNTYFMGGSGE